MNGGCIAMHDVQNLFMLMPEFLRFTPLYILSGSCFLYREEIAAPLPTLKIENMFPLPLRRGGGPVYTCMSFKFRFVCNISESVYFDLN